MSKPKKPPKRSRSIKTIVNTKKTWEDIIKDTDKKEVPLEVLEMILVELIDGTNVEINIRELLSEGQDPDQLEQHLNQKFRDLDSLIENIDFYVDIDKVAKAVQVRTDDILKNL
jgi:hypothetical protein